MATRRGFLGSGLAAAFGWLGGSALTRGTTTQGVPSSAPVASNGSLTAANRPAPHVVTDARQAGVEALYEALKRSGPPEDLYRFLYALPKGGDIHHHLGGGFLPAMWYAVATDPQRSGGQRFYTRVRISSPALLDVVPAGDSRNTHFWTTITEQAYARLAPEVQADFEALDALDAATARHWQSSLVLDTQSEGRDEFFEYIWPRLNHLLRSIHVVSELLVENMRRFGAEGVRYLELQTGFQGWRDAQDRPLTPEEATAFFQKRLAQEDARATGVLVRFQAVVLRFLPEAEAHVRDTFAFLDRHRDFWVGINMAGREDDNRGYAQRFTEVYDAMLRRYPGIGISIHAGEAEKRDTQIFDTLRLGAQRIGHGINLIHDEPTLLRMRSSRFLIEINLISNHLLGYTPDLSQHPFPIYLRQGIPVCLNTDDRGMWSSNMTDEYFVAVRRYGLSWQELTQLAETSLEHSFLPLHERQALLTSYREALAAFGRRFSGEDARSALSAIPAETYGYGRTHLGLKL